MYLFFPARTLTSINVVLLLKLYLRFRKQCPIYVHNKLWLRYGFLYGLVDLVSPIYQVERLWICAHVWTNSILTDWGGGVIVVILIYYYYYYYYYYYINIHKRVMYGLSTISSETFIIFHVVPPLVVNGRWPWARVQVPLWMIRPCLQSCSSAGLYDCTPEAL